MDIGFHLTRHAAVGCSLFLSCMSLTYWYSNVTLTSSYFHASCRQRYTFPTYIRLGRQDTLFCLPSHLHSSSSPGRLALKTLTLVPLFCRHVNLKLPFCLSSSLLPEGTLSRLLCHLQKRVPEWGPPGVPGHGLRQVSNGGHGPHPPSRSPFYPKLPSKTTS